MSPSGIVVGLPSRKRTLSPIVICSGIYSNLMLTVGVTYIAFCEPIICLVAMGKRSQIFYNGDDVSISAQRLIRKARIEVDKAPTCPQDLQEAKFWEKLRSVCLLPEQAAFSQSDELKEKLIELRNTGLVMLTVINILWMIVMLTIIAQGNKLHILNTNFLGLLFLSLYTIVLLVQFCTLLWHRVGTWIHLMSRTPFKPGSSINMSWSFHDDELPPEPTDNSLFIAKQRINSRKGRLSRQRRSSPDNSKAFRTIVPPSEEVNW